MAAAAQRNPSKILSLNSDRLSDSDAEYQHLASSKAGVPLLNYAWVVTSLIQARLSLDTSFAAVAKYFLLEGEKGGKKMYALILQSLCTRNRRWDLFGFRVMLRARTAAHDIALEHCTNLVICMQLFECVGWGTDRTSCMLRNN